MAMVAGLDLLEPSRGMFFVCVVIKGELCGVRLCLSSDVHGVFKVFGRKVLPFSSVAKVRRPRSFEMASILSRVYPMGMHPKMGVFEVRLGRDVSRGIGKATVDGLWVQIKGHRFFVELRDTADNRASIFFSGGVGVVVVFTQWAATYPQGII